MALLRRIAAALVFALLFDGGGAAQTANEYDVKAAFLYNFTRFVEWPPDAGAAQFCIGVAGADPFQGALERAVSGRTAAGRGMVVRYFKAGTDPSGCDLVFVTGSDIRKARASLATLHGPVLTVGEAPGFCKSGGVIGFTLQNDKIKLEINLDAAQRARLQISSKLLSLASVMRDPAE